MAFTLQWANTVNDRTESEIGRFNRYTKTFKMKLIVKAYQERIRFLSPLMCVQADVLYPNAWAAVKNIGPDGEQNNSGEEDVYAVGCKGHQLDNEFPFESRTPIALPLLQYQTDTRGDSTQEQDMCALPVLNWEKYIKEFSKSTSLIPKKFARTTRAQWRREKSVAKALAASRAATTTNELVENQESEVHDEFDEHLSPPPHPLELSDLEEDEHSDVDKLVSTPLEEDDIEIESFQRIQPAEPAPTLPSRKRNSNPWPKFEVVPVRVIIGRDSVKKKKFFTRLVQKKNPIRSRPLEMTRFQTKKILYRNDNDLELNERDEIDRIQKQTTSVQDGQTPEPQFDIKFKENTADMIPLSTLRKYKIQPDVKIMGTWNFLYGGNGACDWVYDSSDHNRRNILVGNGTKLRMATIKPADKTSMLSYVVDSVWEEDEFPTNIDPVNPQKDDILSDVITKIVAPRKRGMCLAAVQRGRSVEIYHIEETPSLVTSIPNTRYGCRRYLTGKHHTTDNPLLLSCDTNPVFPSEIITMDENNVVRLIDFVAKKTKRQFHGEKKKCNRKRYVTFGKQWAHLYPKFRINEGGGVAYSTHPSTFYQWCDSQIYFHDERTPIESMTSSTELLNLRAATSSMSWSDQQYYTKPRKLVSEYVSNVKPSPNSTYYYVGTSERIFLMDMRVPGNPVLKMSHGMKSAATYMNIYKDKNFEVLIAGSQRLPQIFCSVHDFAHVSCIDRPECKARNPILQSHPRHLSNSREFFECANTKGHGFGWESDYQRVRDQCYAWTTGLCVLPGLRASDPTKPQGVIVLNSNTYGDIFYQEWDPKPLHERRETEIGSSKLKKFLSGWTKAMTPSNFNTFRRPTENRYALEDCTMLIEPNAEAVRESGKVRTKPFDPFTPYALTYNRVDQKLKTVNEQVQTLKKFNGPLVDTILRQWVNYTELTDEQGGTEEREVVLEDILEEPEPDEPEEAEVQHETIDFKQELDMDIEEPEEYQDPLLQSHEVEIQPSATSNSTDVNEIINAQNSDENTFESTTYDQTRGELISHPDSQESEVMIVDSDPNQPDAAHTIYQIISPSDEFENAQTFQFQVEGEDGQQYYYILPMSEENAAVFGVNQEEAEEEAAENAYVVEQNILASGEMFQDVQYDDSVEDGEVSTSSQYITNTQFEPTDLSKAGGAFSISYTVPSPGLSSAEHKPELEESDSQEMDDLNLDDSSD